MREFWLIFQQAFLTKARTKSFIITTGIMMASIVFMANLPKLLTVFDSIGDSEANQEKQIIIQTESDTLYEQLSSMNAQSQGNELELIRGTDSIEAGLKQVREEESFAMIAITESVDHLEATYYTAGQSKDSEASYFEELLQTIQTEQRAQQVGITSEEFQLLMIPVQFSEENIVSQAKDETVYLQAAVLVYVLMFVIYFAVIMYASMIATEVATEKSSRVMEILISSVSPVKHMFAKVLGIGTLGLVQLLLLGATATLVLLTNQSAESYTQLLNFQELPISIIIYAVLFFLLGYFLYATLAALLGSLVSRTEDVQQMIMPMTLLIVAAFIIAMAGLNNPEMAFLRWASYFPFFTPLVMFLRVGMLDLPLWEPVLGIGIMLLTILVLGIFGARVYKGGVLMYGPSRTLRDLKRALQLGKENK